jgi:hypothetical protein
MKFRTLDIDDPNMPLFQWHRNGSILKSTDINIYPTAVKLTGKAIPDMAHLAWKPFIYDLIDYFRISPGSVFNRQKFTIDFCLDFYNTGSSKYLSEIFHTLQLNSNKCEIIFNWYYFEADEDSLADAEMFKESRLNSNIQINLIVRND